MYLVRFGIRNIMPAIPGSAVAGGFVAVFQALQLH